MALQHSVDLVLEAHIGEGSLSQDSFDAALGLVRDAMDRLAEDEASGRVPLLRLPQEAEDLPGIREAASWLRWEATDVVFLGTGGASLGGQVLAQLRDYAVPGAGRFTESPRIHFLDNLDPVTFDHVLHRLPLSSTRFVAVSKSGGTGETLMQAMAVLSCLEKAGLRTHPKDVFLGLSEPRRAGGRNALRDLLEPEGARFLEHHPGIGERYSALTNVGLLPAAVLGLDIEAIRQGAAEVLKPFRAGRDAREVPAAVGAALNVALARQGRSTAVTMAYADRLERFTRWWAQLWAESLGRGFQPAAALGLLDRHCQLELQLAGLNDRFFTILTTGVEGQGPLMDEKFARRVGKPDLAGKRMGDFVAAQGRAAAEALARNGRPIRRIHVEKLDERGLGELLMHFMLETILTSHALGVDPFGRSAAEEGRSLTPPHPAQG